MTMAQAAQQGAGSPVPTTTADAALVSAYEAHRTINAELNSLPLEEEARSDAIAAEMAELDRVLFGTEPQTVAGVNAILRRVLPMLEAERWLDRAITYGDDETLAERREELGGPYPQLVGCILALSRMVKDRR